MYCTCRLIYQFQTVLSLRPTCVIAILHLGDVIMNIGILCSLNHVLVRGVLDAIFDVLPQTAGKQLGLLAHHTYLGSTQTHSLPKKT